MTEDRREALILAADIDEFGQDDDGAYWGHRDLRRLIIRLIESREAKAHCPGCNGDHP